MAASNSVGVELLVSLSPLSNGIKQKKKTDRKRRRRRHWETFAFNLRFFYYYIYSKVLDIPADQPSGERNRKEDAAAVLGKTIPSAYALPRQIAIQQQQDEEEEEEVKSSNNNKVEVGKRERRRTRVSRPPLDRTRWSTDGPNNWFFLVTHRPSLVLNSGVCSVVRYTFSMYTKYVTNVCVYSVSFCSDSCFFYPSASDKHKRGRFSSRDAKIRQYLCPTV